MNSTIYAEKIYTKESGVTKDNVFTDKKVLHIGCGKNKLEGVVGVDLLKLPGVDVVHDLDNYPWPFANNGFDLVYAHSVVEHITDIVSLFDEIARILKVNGRLVLAVPYFRSVDAFTDLTHKHFFTSNSLDYFLNTKSSLSAYEYSSVRFKKVGFWYGWPQTSRNPFTKIFKFIIHKYPRFYDQYLSLFLPVKIMVWELEVDKGFNKE